MTYGFLLESIWHPPLMLEDRVKAGLPMELELQALWFSGAFGRRFRTTDGRAVKVVQFGEWNRGAGPDFLHCAVELDGETLTGPVELDPDSDCWEVHGHAANEAFDGVILHVVFRPDGMRKFIRTSTNREVPQVVIDEVRLSDALNLPQRDVAIAHPGRCVHPLARMPEGAVGRLLDEAAIHRAQLKAQRFLRAADAHGRDEALYQATAETLGYRGNSLAMKLLSQRASLAVLREEEEGSAEAVLLGTAGFLSLHLHEVAPEDTREYLRGLWDRWWKSRYRFEVVPNRRIPWRLSGQRPANHPHRRVGALAALHQNWGRYRKLALARPFEVKPLVDFLQAIDHEFWSYRHTLGAEATGRRVSLFGKSRALELVANHLAPLAMHDGGMTYRSYRAIRYSAANDSVKRCGIRLFGSQERAAPWTRRLAHHQALLQVYQDFCLEDFSDCEACPFPEQLQQWR